MESSERKKGGPFKQEKKFKKKKYLESDCQLSQLATAQGSPSGGATPCRSVMHHAASLKMEGKFILMREVFSAVICSFNVKILSSSDKTPAVASSVVFVYFCPF